MSTARRKLLWLCGGGAAAWLLGGQLLRSVAGPGYHPPASESSLAYLAILGPAAVCVAWAAFLVRTEWRHVLPAAGALAAASRVGSLLSDLLTHLAGEPVDHDTWFADDRYYWADWLTGGLLSFLALSGLLALCLLVFGWVERRNPAT